MRIMDLVADVLAAQRGRRAANTIAAYQNDLHRFTRTLSGPVEGIVAADLRCTVPEGLRLEIRNRGVVGDILRTDNHGALLSIYHSPLSCAHM